MTLEMSQMTIFDCLDENEDQYNLSLEGFRAKLSQLLENEKDSEMQREVLYFLKSSASHLCSDQSIYSWKMLQDFLAMKGGEPSASSSMQWQRWGTMLSGRCIIQARMSLKTESVCSLSQVLEDEVDEKYFLSEQKTQALLKSLEDPKETDTIKTDECTEQGGVAPTLSTMQGGGQEPKVLVVGNTNPSGNGMNGQVFDSEGIAPTITTNKGEGVKILQRNFSGQYSAYEGHTGTLQASRVDKVPMVVEPIPVLTPDREEKRQNGRRMKEPGEPMFTLTAQDRHSIAINKVGNIDTDKGQTGAVYDPKGIAPTQLNQHGNAVTKIIDTKNRHCRDNPQAYDICPTIQANDYKEPKKVTDGYRIRKLTPLECFRLQSFPDWWYYKLKEHGISDSQLYKMAGNGVTSDVAYDIGRRLPV